MTTRTKIAACPLALGVLGAACNTPPSRPGGTTTTTTWLPPINPIVADHDFESSASGWVPYLTGSGGPLTDRENLHFSKVLGPFSGHPSGGVVVGQRFPLTGDLGSAIDDVRIVET